MDYETLILEKKEHIATITLNRPQALNAANPRMHEELADVFVAVDRDDETRVVVITGAGRAFCTGADVKESFAKHAEKVKAGEMPFDVVFNLGVDHWAMALQCVRKPTIAAIHGYAIGLGLTLALNCDIRICAEDAKLALRFAEMNNIPEAGSTFLLPRIVGYSKALELFFDRRFLDGKEAKEIGLVNKVVPPDDLLKTTYELGSAIAKLPPLAVRLGKRGLRQSLSADHAAQLQFEAFAQLHLRRTEDFAESTRAFIEKREPVFKGR